MSVLKPVTLQRADFHGWKAVHLDNGIVHIVAVPDIGGRVMALNLGESALFFVDPNLAGKLFTAKEHIGDGSPNAWKNYGGDKTWPAPQGWNNDDQWHGPPDPVLDGGRYSLSIQKATDDLASIAMKSAPDLQTGVQITRQLTLRRGGSRVNLDLSFTNTGERPRRWSIWDVTQLRADRELPNGKHTAETECVITAPRNPESRFPNGYNVMFASPDNPQWTVDSERGLILARYQFEIGKIGIDSTADWIAFYNGAKKHGFIVQYPFFAGEEYPDLGVPLEVWTVGRGKIPGINYDYENSGIYLMETEVLSPLFTFQPGETRTFSIEWGVSQLPGMVIENSEAGAISQPLVADRIDSLVHFSGQFGVYDQGVLEVAWLDEEKNFLSAQNLALVTPFQPLLLDETIKPPKSAAWLMLQVVADFDRTTRFLAEVKL